MLSINENSFAKTVLESSHPVLVHFWAPWCGLCRFIQPTLEKFQSEWEGDLQIIGINADENFKLANKFRLRNLPTLILFEQGVPIYRLESFRSREELQHTLKSLPINQMAKYGTRRIVQGASPVSSSVPKSA